MDSKAVIESISEIYKRFRVSANLQMHMLRCASVGQLICDNWSGEKLNKDEVTAVLLIHDLGNIVKFDLDSGIRAEVYGDAAENLDYLRKVKAEVIKKYGSDDRDATNMMAEELGIGKRMLDILKIQGHIFSVDNIPIDSIDIESKICAYSDCRVGPLGVLGIKDRFDDLIKRYDGTPKAHLFASLSKSALILEQSIMQHSSIKPEQINDQSISPYMERLR